ncbi:MAG: HTH domain-containing protein [bacterium]|nr:HTH domain-containing protein [bacterium]
MPKRSRGDELKRGDRLEALVAAIRAREGVSMGELAEELAVSVRTVRRDVALLRARGLDIEGDRGRGGGIRFARFAPLPPLQLDAQQAVGLWLSVEIARRVSGLPFSRGNQSAMNKVLASLPPERRVQLRQLCRRIVIGTRASEAMRESFGEMSPTLLDTFERCFRESVCMRFRYTDRLGAVTQRRVEPHGIFVRAPFWYILAVDIDRVDADPEAGAEEVRRQFRMDRIANPRVISRRFTPSIEIVDEMLEDEPYFAVASGDAWI